MNKYCRICESILIFFTKQLIDDKKTLSEKYDTVVRDLKLVDKKYSTKIKAMEDT